MRDQLWFSNSVDLFWEAKVHEQCLVISLHDGQEHSQVCPPILSDSGHLACCYQILLDHVNRA